MAVIEAHASMATYDREMAHEGVHCISPCDSVVIENVHISRSRMWNVLRIAYVSPYDNTASAVSFLYGTFAAAFPPFHFLGPFRTTYRHRYGISSTSSGRE